MVLPVTVSHCDVVFRECGENWSSPEEGQLRCSGFTHCRSRSAGRGGWSSSAWFNWTLEKTNKPQCFPMVCNALGFLLKHSTVFYNGGDDYLTLPRMLETGPVLPSSGEVW